MIPVVFALQLAAASASSAAACTLLNPAACEGTGALVRDEAFRAALKSFVGARQTGYLAPGGQAYAEAMTVLSGPPQPVRRLRSLYLFTACSDQSCDEQGAVALQPDGELAGVAILHTDCARPSPAKDCFTHDVLSILKGQDDDLSVVDGLTDWARREMIARRDSPGAPAASLDRVEVLAGIAAKAPQVRLEPSLPAVLPNAPIAGPFAPIAKVQAPAIAIPPPRPQSAPPPPVVTVRPEPAKPAPPVVRAEAPPPPPPSKPPVAVAAVPEAEPAKAQTDDGATIVDSVTAVVRPMAPLIGAPVRLYWVIDRPERRVDVDPPPPPPPPPPKPPKRPVDWWKWHWTPYD